MRAKHGANSSVAQAVDRLNMLADSQNRIVDTLMERGVPYDEALKQACKIIPIPRLLTKYVLTNVLYEQATHYKPEPHMHYDWSQVEH